MAASARKDRPQATPKQRASDVRVALGGGAQETNAQAEFERLSRAASGGGAVSSVFARSGAVVAADADYTAGQVVVTPAGAMSSTRVQAALEEVQADATTGITNAAAAQSTANAAIPKSIIDAKGDLIVGSADNTASRLAVGVVAGHVLAVKPAATNGVDWIPLPTADTTTPGIVELATDAETIAGTDATRAVTPASLAARIALIVIPIAALAGSDGDCGPVIDAGDATVTAGALV